MNRVKTLLLVSRPISWVNTAYPFAAAYIVSRPGPFNWTTLVIGTLFFLNPYNLLMYGINDVFDYESDIRNPRKGGIEGAVTQKSLHRLIIIAALTLCVPPAVYLLAVSPRSAAIYLLFSLFMVLAYSAPKLRFKERPVLDSFTSATHFVSPMIYGLLLAGWTNRAWLAVIAFYAWAMASHALGAIQDIEADRAGNIASVATVFGSRRTLWLVIVAYLIAAGTVCAYGWPGIAVGLVTLLYAVNAAAHWRVTDATVTTVNKAWRRFLWLNYVTGFVITLTLIAILR